MVFNCVGVGERVDAEYGVKCVECGGGIEESSVEIWLSVNVDWDGGVSVEWFEGLLVVSVC